MIKPVLLSLSFVVSTSGIANAGNHSETITSDFERDVFTAKIACLEWRTAAYLGIGLPAIHSDKGFVSGNNADFSAAIVLKPAVTVLNEQYPNANAAQIDSFNMSFYEKGMATIGFNAARNFIQTETTELDHTALDKRIRDFDDYLRHHCALVQNLV